MNREEILAKSRAEKMDEGMQQAENRGRRIGVSAFCCVYVFIVIFNFVQGYPSYGFHAMFWAFVAAEAYPKYRFTVGGALACAASLGSFVISVLR